MVARKIQRDKAVGFADRPLRLAHPEPGAEKFEDLLAELSGTFIRTAAENIDDQIELWLQRIVLSLGLDRGTLSQFDSNDSGLWVTHQWARKGIPAPDRGREVSQYLPWLAEKIASGEMVVFSNLPYRLPRKAVGEREFIASDGVKGHITLPLKIGENAIGGLSFATVLNERRWTKQEIQRLRLGAADFGNALERKRASAEHRRLEQDLLTTAGVAIVGELGAVLMHELKQPLTAILANAEIAQNLLSHRNPRVAEIRAALADIIRDNARADDLLGKVRAIFQTREAAKSHVEVQSLPRDVERIAGMTVRTGVQSARTVSAASEADSRPAGAEKRPLDAVSLIIVQEVCDQFRLTPAEIFSKSRIARIALGRMIAIYLCRLITNSSFARIGDAFDRDHSTVLHAIRHIESMMMQRPMLQETILSISERIRKRSGL